jgi:RsiW-degrading membrane proteinase PrsW (M82 family)
MTNSNLAILILVLAVTLFIVSAFTRNPARNTPTLDVIRRTLSLIVLGLAAIYFYNRFMG